MPSRYIQTLNLPDKRLPHYEQTQALACLNLAAGMTKLRDSEALSHSTSGLLWDLPWYGTDVRVHTSYETTRRTSRNGFALHTANIDPSCLRTVDGIVLTDLEQTALDLAAVRPPHQGLAFIDYARRRGATVERLLELAEQRQGNGRIRTLRLVHASVANSDSPKESECRYWLHKAGVRGITTQLHIPTRLGDFYGDIHIDGTPLIYEYDGEGKYSEDGQTLRKEKRREDAIRELGFVVVRVTRHELSNPHSFIHSVHQRLKPYGYELAGGSKLLVP
jgi:very-short-patch-repair endonuclease